MRVLVIGAGVAGLCCAVELARAGASVEIIDRASGLGVGACSWVAGGMLAPYCEGEATEPLVTQLGAQALAWWRELCPDLVQAGTLVVAHDRDRGELDRFARRTEQHRQLKGEEIDLLEPDLAGRFRRALYFADEAHLNPRLALASLQRELRERGVEIRFNCDLASYRGDAQVRVDCRGLSARTELGDLRGVKGEMLCIRSAEVVLQRPVRLLHPRIPLYIVPRGQGLYMIGATMIESDNRKRISVRSMIELLQAAYAVHPAFAEAEVVEIGSDARPAFPDNLPAIRQDGSTIYLNGLYRHGFLLAPAMARQVAERVLNTTHSPEDSHADFVQQQVS